MPPTTAQPCYSAPAARGAIAYYSDKRGIGFLCVQRAGNLFRLGEDFELHGKTYVVAGFTEGVEGIKFRMLGQEVVECDGLPVARYLPVVSKPSPAQLADAAARVAKIAQRDPAAFVASFMAAE